MKWDGKVRAMTTTANTITDEIIEDGNPCPNCRLQTLKVVRQTKDDRALYGERTCTCTICSHKWGQRFEHGKWVNKEANRCCTGT